MFNLRSLAERNKRMRKELEDDDEFMNYLDKTDKKSRQSDLDHVETFETLTLKRNEKLKMIKEFEEQITTDTSNQEGEEDEEDELEAYMAEINNKVKNEQVKKAKSLLEETRKELLEIEKMMNLADPQAWKKVQNGSFKPVDKLLNTPAVKLTNIPAITASSNLKLEKPVNKQSNKAVFFKEMGFSKPKIVEPILLKPQQGPSKKELERQQALMENDEDFVDLPMNEQTGIDLNSASQKYGY